jgi:hypothetical protein
MRNAKRFLIPICVGLLSSSVLSPSVSFANFNNVVQRSSHFYNSDGQATPAVRDLLKVTGVKVEGDFAIANVNKAIAHAGWIAPHGVERWDLQLPNNLKGKEEEIIAICHSQLNMAEEIFPQKSKSDGILLLGTTFQGVLDRVNFLWKMVLNGKLDQDNKVFVLTGQRPLNIKEGETPEEMGKIMTRTTPMPNNEYEMMQYVLAHRGIPQGMKVQYVYSEKESGHTRATTKSTMEMFLSLHAATKKTHFVAISNQPYAFYQETALNLALQKHGRADISIEVIGSKADIELDKDNQAAILLDTVAKTSKNLGELGVGVSR